MKYSHIPNNLKKIKEEMANILEEKQRKPETCKLLVVTKTRTEDEIKAVINAGHYLLGENRVQELRTKLELFQDYKDIEWHFIGHLQSNKFKYLAGRIKLIHSIDSIKLLNYIDSFCRKKDIRQDILLEFNVSGEYSKYGFDPSSLIELRDIIPEIKNINIKGLMTMAPFTDDYDFIRKVFRQLKKISDKFNGISNFANNLSMGMSNDYRIAIEEGSNIIRIGSRIFEK